MRKIKFLKMFFLTISLNLTINVYNIFAMQTSRNLNKRQDSLVNVFNVVEKISNNIKSYEVKLSLGEDESQLKKDIKKFKDKIKKYFSCLSDLYESNEVYKLINANIEKNNKNVKITHIQLINQIIKCQINLIDKIQQLLCINNSVKLIMYDKEIKVLLAKVYDKLEENKKLTKILNYDENNNENINYILKVINGNEENIKVALYAIEVINDRLVDLKKINELIKNLSKNQDNYIQKNLNLNDEVKKLELKKEKKMSLKKQTPLEKAEKGLEKTKEVNGQININKKCIKDYAKNIHDFYEKDILVSKDEKATKFILPTKISNEKVDTEGEKDIIKMSETDVENKTKNIEIDEKMKFPEIKSKKSYDNLLDENIKIIENNNYRNKSEESKIFYIIDKIFDKLGEDKVEDFYKNLKNDNIFIWNLSYEKPDDYVDKSGSQFVLSLYLKHGSIKNIIRMDLIKYENNIKNSNNNLYFKEGKENKNIKYVYCFNILGKEFLFDEFYIEKDFDHYKDFIFGQNFEFLTKNIKNTINYVVFKKKDFDQEFLNFTKSASKTFPVLKKSDIKNFDELFIFLEQYYINKYDKICYYEKNYEKNDKILNNNSFFERLIYENDLIYAEILNNVFKLDFFKDKKNSDKLYYIDMKNKIIFSRDKNEKYFKNLDFYGTMFNIQLTEQKIVEEEEKVYQLRKIFQDIYKVLSFENRNKIRLENEISNEKVFREIFGSELDENEVEKTINELLLCFKLKNIQSSLNYTTSSPNFFYICTVEYQILNPKDFTEFKTIYIDLFQDKQYKIYASLLGESVFVCQNPTKNILYTEYIIGRFKGLEKNYYNRYLHTKDINLLEDPSYKVIENEDGMFYMVNGKIRYVKLKNSGFNKMRSTVYDRLETLIFNESDDFNPYYVCLDFSDFIFSKGDKEKEKIAYIGTVNDHDYFVINKYVFTFNHNFKKYKVALITGKYKNFIFYDRLPSANNFINIHNYLDILYENDYVPLTVNFNSVPKDFCYEYVVKYGKVFLQFNNKLIHEVREVQIKEKENDKLVRRILYLTTNGEKKQFYGYPGTTFLTNDNKTDNFFPSFISLHFIKKKENECNRYFVKNIKCEEKYYGNNTEIFDALTKKIFRCEERSKSQYYEQFEKNLKTYEICPQIDNKYLISSSIVFFDLYSSSGPDFFTFRQINILYKTDILSEMFSNYKAYDTGLKYQNKVLYFDNNNGLKIVRDKEEDKLYYNQLMFEPERYKFFDFEKDTLRNLLRKVVKKLYKNE